MFLCAVPEKIDMLLKMAGVYTVVDRYDTVKQALDIIKNKHDHNEWEVY